jgi:hypothetical protein
LPGGRAPPTSLFVVTIDTLRAGYLGCYGLSFDVYDQPLAAEHKAGLEVATRWLEGTRQRRLRSYDPHRPFDPPWQSAGSPRPPSWRGSAT